jgi:hypothetical protein
VNDGHLQWNERSWELEEDSPPPITHYRTDSLEERVLGMIVPINDEDLHLRPEIIRDMLRQRILLKFRRILYGKKVEAQTVTITEEPVYHSPKHAFVASLEHGFWRRFWAHWFEIDPQETLAFRRVHEVTIERWANFPDLHMPEGFGPVVYQQKMRHNQHSEDV